MCLRSEKKSSIQSLHRIEAPNDKLSHLYLEKIPHQPTVRIPLFHTTEKPAVAMARKVRESKQSTIEVGQETRNWQGEFGDALPIWA